MCTIMQQQLYDCEHLRIVNTLHTVEITLDERTPVILVHYLR